MERKPVYSWQKLKDRRRELRNSATPEERILWERIRRRQLGFKIYRQYSIGPNIADFYCASKKLVIELDGKHHLMHQGYDKERTDYFNDLGIKVLRFWNDEIDKNIESVIKKILHAM